MSGRSRVTARVTSKALAGPEPAPERRQGSRRNKPISKPSKRHVALPLEVQLEARTSDS